MMHIHNTMTDITACPSIHTGYGMITSPKGPLQRRRNHTLWLWRLCWRGIQVVLSVVCLRCKEGPVSCEVAGWRDLLVGPEGKTSWMRNSFGRSKPIVKGFTEAGMSSVLVGRMVKWSIAQLSAPIRGILVPRNEQCVWLLFVCNDPYRLLWKLGRHLEGHRQSEICVLRRIWGYRQPQRLEHRWAPGPSEVWYHSRGLPTFAEDSLAVQVDYSQVFVHKSCPTIRVGIGVAAQVNAHLLDNSKVCEIDTPPNES